jgi:hypothetical protein
MPINLHSTFFLTFLTLTVFLNRNLAAEGAVCPPNHKLDVDCPTVTPGCTPVLQGATPVCKAAKDGLVWMAYINCSCTFTGAPGVMTMCPPGDVSVPSPSGYCTTNPTSGSGRERSNVAYCTTANNPGCNQQMAIERCQNEITPTDTQNCVGMCNAMIAAIPVKSTGNPTTCCEPLYSPSPSPR